jgi:hypothetical protein
METNPEFDTHIVEKTEQQKFQDWLFAFREELQMTLMTKLGFGLVSKNFSLIVEDHQDKFDTVGNSILDEVKAVDDVTNQKNTDSVLEWITFGYSELFADLFEEYVASVPRFAELKKIAETDEGREELLEKIEDEFAPKFYEQMKEEMKKREEDKAPLLPDEDVVEEINVA